MQNAPPSGGLRRSALYSAFRRRVTLVAGHGSSHRGCRRHATGELASRAQTAPPFEVRQRRDPNDRALLATPAMPTQSDRPLVVLAPAKVDLDCSDAPRAAMDATGSQNEKAAVARQRVLRPARAVRNDLVRHGLIRPRNGRVAPDPPLRLGHGVRPRIARIDPIRMDATSAPAAARRLPARRLPARSLPAGHRNAQSRRERHSPPLPNARRFGPAASAGWSWPGWSPTHPAAGRLGALVDQQNEAGPSPLHLIRRNRLTHPNPVEPFADRAAPRQLGEGADSLVRNAVRARGGQT